MLKATLAGGVLIIVFVVASSFLNPTPDAIQHARIENQLERMELMQTVGNVAIVGLTAILLIALIIGLRWLWSLSGRPLQLRAEDGLFPAVVIDRSTAWDRLTGQRRIFAHDPNRSGGASLGINIGRNGEITAHGAQVDTPDQAAIIKAALSVQKVQAGYRRGPTVAEIKGDLGYYDKTPRPAIITEQKQLPQQTAQPPLTLSEAIRQVGAGGDIPLGQNEETNALAVWKPASAPHLSLLGSTQQGKTSCVGFTIAATAIKHGWRVVILDPEEEGQWRAFSTWAEWANADEDSVTPYVLAVHAEYVRRGEIMVSSRVDSFTALAAQTNVQRVLLIIEEYGDLRSRAARAGTVNEFDSALAQLAKRGAKRGFHLLLLDQHYKATDSAPPWPESVADNVHRLSFHQSTRDTSLVGVYGMPDLEVGQFGYKSNVYRAWHAKPEVGRILAGVPRLTGPRILDNVPVSGVRPPGADTPSTGVNSPSATQRTPDTGQSTGQELTEIQRQVAVYLQANPDAGVRSMARDLDISKSYAGELREEYLRRPPAIDAPTPPAPDVWSVLGREVIDLTDDAGIDEIRRIDWRKVEVK